jgi:hypothetical protein
MTRKYTNLPYKEYVVASGNYDTTRKPIDTIVLHHTNSTFESAVAWFGNPKAGTSAHYVVANDGRIAAMLEEYSTAYHCGNYDVNQRSIGIETEWYKDMVRGDTIYETVAKLVADICSFYKIPADRSHIRKHNEIFNTQCPGTLDVERIVKRTNEILKANIDPNSCEAKLSAIIVERDRLNGIIGVKDKEIKALKEKILILEPLYEALQVDLIKTNQELDKAKVETHTKNQLFNDSAKKVDLLISEMNKLLAVLKAHA